MAERILMIDDEEAYLSAPSCNLGNAGKADGMPEAEKDAEEVGVDVAQMEATIVYATTSVASIPGCF